jgi:hypothetical protein
MRWHDIEWWSRLSMIVIYGYNLKIHFCRRDHIERKYRINSIVKILKSSYLNLNICKRVLIILDSDANELEIVTQSYYKWFHSKIIFKNQMMIKILIWLNLTVASLCTLQVWNFLVPESSTCSEESIDYKFVAIGFTEQKLWILWCL